MYSHADTVMMVPGTEAGTMISPEDFELITEYSFKTEHHNLRRENARLSSKPILYGGSLKFARNAGTL